MKKSLIPLFLVFISVISCSKSGGDSSTPPIPADKYMSTTAGSSWNYETTDNVAATTSPYTLTSTSRDSLVNNKNYHVYINSGNNASEYYNISGGDYTSFQNLPAAVGGSKAENLYLKDNVSVNESWSESYNITISSVTVKVTLVNKIIETEVNITINGKTYTKVIHVQTSITADGVPPASLTSDIQSYYAPKVGLVQNTTKINLNYLTIVNNTDTKTILKSSTIL
jgi:hypothetical protein